ncbi:putative acyl-coenzyme A binding domain containing [Hibiscus syriacus]|uniref:glucan endo-1,3-beta-D-glucosidase n=1 Tax=Hibiscus syriacus TaxID=106335 RepID=A0A6A2YFQ9_HIBSY|nr:putative acyl-coenzyme A binding domain containing [Hibiscus syriacus]
MCSSRSVAVCSLFLVLTLIGVEGTIGVNYGTLANNLPPPPRVAKFLKESTVINHVRLFDANPEFLRAFAHTGISVTVTVPNDQIPGLTRLNFAQQWVEDYIRPHTAATNIVRVLVGNEVISTADRLLIVNLVPAMQTLQAALAAASLDGRIQVSTPHSLGILSNSTPPSTGKFRQGYDTHVLKPLLSFLRDTKSPFMLLYTNMLDAELDAVYSAMKLLGFDDVEIVIAETGWPSMGDPVQVSVDTETAAEYNGNLMRHVKSGVGTPLMPNRTFETYIFALFDEDLKPGPTCERYFGLFRPDLTPAYDIGILRPTVAAAAANIQHATCLLVIAASEARDDAFVTTATPVPTTAPSHQMPIYDRKQRLCLPEMILDEKWFAMEYRARVQLAFSHP